MQVATTMGFIYIYSIPKLFRIVWSFFSPNLLSKAFSLLMEESSTNQEQFLVNRPPRCPPNNPGCEIITVVSKIIQHQTLLLNVVYLLMLVS